MNDIEVHLSEGQGDAPVLNGSLTGLPGHAARAGEVRVGARHCQTAASQLLLKCGHG